MNDQEEALQNLKAASYDHQWQNWIDKAEAAIDRGDHKSAKVCQHLAFEVRMKQDFDHERSK